LQIIAFFTFTPDLLVSDGYSMSLAGLLASIPMWPGIILSPIIGYVIHKSKNDHKIMIMVISTLAVAFFLFWFPWVTGWIGWIILLMPLTGIAINMMPTPVNTIVSEVVKPEKLGLGFGIMTTCLNTGILAGPAIVGLVRDITGSYPISYIVMSVFALAVIFFLFALNRLRRSQNRMKDQMRPG